MAKLVIEIEFGNEAMQRYAQARIAINECVKTGALKPAVGDCGKLRDVNGNTVGKWEVIE
jgi:hypothetical protein